MPMKRFYLLPIVLSLLLSGHVPNAMAAVRAGATCAKISSTATVSGYRYICIKSGKKLVWGKGVRVAVKTTPTPTPTPTAGVEVDELALSRSLVAAKNYRQALTELKRVDQIVINNADINNADMSNINEKNTYIPLKINKIT